MPTDGNDGMVARCDNQHVTPIAVKGYPVSARDATGKDDGPLGERLVWIGGGHGVENQ
jgi:hypothetical protein